MTTTAMLDLSMIWAGFTGDGASACAALGQQNFTLAILFATVAVATITVAWNDRYWPEIEGLLTSTNPLETFSVEKYGALAWIFRIGMSLTVLSAVGAVGCAS